MRIGSICYATEQGLGRLAKSFHDAGIVSDVLIFRHPGGRATQAHWYPPGTPVLTRRPFLSGGQNHAVRDFLNRIDVLLCYETPFDWAILPECRRHGVKTVLIPMHEWTPEKPPHAFDRIISPSLLDQQYFPGSEFVPIPVDPSAWKPRTTALRYLHNAGHIGSRNHKGTEELLRAVKYIQSPLELRITCQDGAGLARLLEATRVFDDKPAHVGLEYVTGDMPYESLFDWGDVYVAPEKLNGISLPLQEARAAGMLVITTDRFPMNTWLPKEPLISVERYGRARVAPGYLEFDEAVVSPQEIARTMDAWYGKNISAYSLSGRAWAEANSWPALKARWLEAIAR